MIKVFALILCSTFSSFTMANCDAEQISPSDLPAKIEATENGGHVLYEVIVPAIYREYKYDEAIFFFETLDFTKNKGTLLAFIEFEPSSKGYMSAAISIKQNHEDSVITIYYITNEKGYCFKKVIILPIEYNKLLSVQR